jgi:hypothetical protein
MNQEEVRKVLSFYFPGSFRVDAPFLKTLEAKLIIDKILESPTKPIHLTLVNQLLHLCHEAGITDGFFRYYFLSEPAKHPYPVGKVKESLPGLDEKGIWSLKQLDWGLHRFYIDALLYWGNIKSAFRDLRTKTYSELEAFFAAKRYDSESMRGRGPCFPFQAIPKEDRYLISELACKAYSCADKESQSTVIEEALIEAYRATKEKRLTIGSLLEKKNLFPAGSPKRIMLEVGTEELLEKTVQSEKDISREVRQVAERFAAARQSAIENTRLYLSVVNELDVYVATSMRRRTDFLSMATDCEYIFSQEGLDRFHVRYFDPTISATDCHEDKGLVECLMVKCAKVTLYFAGIGDSFGKDSEAAMTLSLGKPAIIVCPDSDRGREREQVFKEIHPLSRLIHFDTGVSVGAMVTRSRDVAAQLLERIFDNKMEYDLVHDGDGYFRLKERLTKSVVRLQTNSRILRETFWNYYHGIQ